MFPMKENLKNVIQNKECMIKMVRKGLLKEEQELNVSLLAVCVYVDFVVDYQNGLENPFRKC